MDWQEKGAIGFLCLLVGCLPATIVGIVFDVSTGREVRSAYLRGQIDQASGVATVTLTKQPNGETKWEPTTKAGE